MPWYYAVNREKQGPVSDAEFQALVGNGVVTPETLVWTQGMAKWQPFREVAPAAWSATPAPAPRATAGQAACVECGRLFPESEMVRFQTSLVCANCKPIFFQRLKEGATLSGAFRYGGFWIRLVAQFIDGILLGVVNGVIQFAFGMSMAPGMKPPAPGEAPDMGGFFAMWGMMMILQLAVSAGYETWFVGRFQATPGKMALGLKVVRPNGDRVSYARALGRYFAEILSGLTLAIGYIIAAFDEEKRTLHDRICDTRVVRK